MKKTLLSVAFIAMCASASAQKMNFIPWTENGYLTGSTISDNGKYIAGDDRGGQAFIYNTETGEIKYYLSKELESGEEVSYAVTSEINYINNDGVGVGYVGEDPAKFSFEKGNYDVFKDKNGNSGAFRYLSSDGIMGGLRWDKGYKRTPFIVDKDGNEKSLPLPAPSWFGWEDFQGGSIQGGSADGSVLVGYIMSDFAVQTLAFWIKNYNNEDYSVVPVGKQYYSVNPDDDKPFDYMGAPVISSNGKWVTFAYHKNKDYDHGNMVARYNVIADKMEYITCPQASRYSSYVTSSISDEGTIIGYIDDDRTMSRNAFIVKGDESETKLLAEVYPDVKEWAELDNTGENTPCHITPDGRYIVGFGFVDLNETSYCYGTYWFDTEGSTNAIKNVDATASNMVKGQYGLDGKKIVSTASNHNRIIINKYNNGEVKKILK